MTVRDLLQEVETYPLTVLLVIILPPLLVLLLRLLHGRHRGEESPWRYLHAVLVFWSCIPGMLAAIVSGYAAVFGEGSLLDQTLATLLVCVGPVVTMVLTLFLMAKVVDLDAVPGFDRLTGMFVVLGISFLVVLLLRRLHFWVVSSIWGMLLAGAIFYFVLTWALGRILRTPGATD